MTNDEINIKAVLATQFSDYGKGEKFNKDFHDFLGDSVFSTDGEVWHKFRQLMRPQFIKDRVSDIKTVERHFSVLLSIFQGPQENKIIDVRDLFLRFTLDASTDFLLGRSVDSLKNAHVAFEDAFKYLQQVQSYIARLGSLAWIVLRRKFNRQVKVLNRFVESYIEEALSFLPEELESKTKSDDGCTFLHALAAHMRDRKILRDQLVAVLIAGRDTTAVTLQWLFYELSYKPEVVDKLRAEISERVGPEETPTYDDLKSLKYLQVCGRGFMLDKH
jgi:cytochrome P450